jgi:hypothetical protein
MINGTIIFRHTKFKWFKVGTYIPSLIRFFQNLYNPDNCYYNHVGIVSTNKGIEYLYESVSNGLIKTPVTQYLNNKDYEYLIVTPKFDYNKSEIHNICESLLGTKYDFKYTLFVQLVRQITAERLYIGTTNENKAKKRLYCSEFVAYAFYKASKENYYHNWFLTDVEDIYNDYLKHEMYDLRIN